jgi:hypothetical protein
VDLYIHSPYAFMTGTTFILMAAYVGKKRNAYRTLMVRTHEKQQLGRLRKMEV